MSYTFAAIEDAYVVDDTAARTAGSTNIGAALARVVVAAPVDAADEPDWFDPRVRRLSLSLLSAVLASDRYDREWHPLRPPRPFNPPHRFESNWPSDCDCDRTQPPSCRIEDWKLWFTRDGRVRGWPWPCWCRSPERSDADVER